ncbi:MAG: gamma-glutamyl-gamma-aminobutyrate hydrolase family protein [Clostridia bacterium]|nr:gamma-glutamyl-gamma-aminobutyrate hydrolase family protein [Clostridia bacterium]
MKLIEEQLLRHGGIPFSILPTQDLEYLHYGLTDDRELEEEEKEDLLRVLRMCDGIIMPGGCKIFEYDKFIANYAIENNIPVLGICLGMQTLAAVDCINEKVVDLIDNGVDHKIQEKFAHKVKLTKDSFLYDIVGNEEFLINSKHKCHVLKTNHFDVVGYSEDGIIEAIERKDKRFAIGVQWHPEIIIDDSEEALKIFEKFIEISSQKSY